MRKRSIRGWKNTLFSLVLALAIILEPPMLSLAANDQTVTEKSATEESKTEEGSESEEKEEETEKSSHLDEILGDAEEGKTIFIRNIPLDATEKDLYRFFKKYGSIEYVKLCKDKCSS